MENGIEKVTQSTLPTLAELIADDSLAIKENNLMVLLNQAPPDKWLRQHPIAKIKDANNQEIPLPYLPIERVEYLLSRIYTKWWVEVKSVSCVANSVVVVVRLYVKNPITGEVEWNEGVGANPIQTEKGKGAADFNFVKSNAVQIAAPAAETYAVKDAAEKFGKLFGKDLARRDEISYDTLLKKDIEASDLKALLDLKRESMTKEEIANAERIINGPEKKSFRKLQTLMMSK